MRKTIHNMPPTTADVAIFWLMLGALVAVNFDPGPTTQVHGVTVGFTALGVLCASFGTSPHRFGHTPTHMAKNIMR